MDFIFTSLLHTCQNPILPSSIAPVSSALLFLVEVFLSSRFNLLTSILSAMFIDHHICITTQRSLTTYSAQHSVYKTNTARGQNSRIYSIHPTFMPLLSHPILTPAHQGKNQHFLDTFWLPTKAYGDPFT